MVQYVLILSAPSLLSRSPFSPLAPVLPPSLFFHGELRGRGIGWFPVLTAGSHVYYNYVVRESAREREREWYGSTTSTGLRGTNCSRILRFIKARALTYRASRPPVISPSWPFLYTLMWLSRQALENLFPSLTLLLLSSCSPCHACHRLVYSRPHHGLSTCRDCRGEQSGEGLSMEPTERTLQR